MNKTVRKILYIIAFALAIGAFIYLGNMEYGDEKKILKDNERFANEYNISKDNPFTYVDSRTVLNLLEDGNGFLFLGFSSDEWSKEYAKYLYEVASDMGIEEIYYYDILRDRSEMTKNFTNILNKLEEYLVKTDTKEAYLFVPKLLVIKNGTVIFEDDTTALVKGSITPKDYWTANNIIDFKNRLYENLTLEDKVPEEIPEEEEFIGGEVING